MQNGVGFKLYLIILLKSQHADKHYLCEDDYKVTVAAKVLLPLTVELQFFFPSASSYSMFVQVNL